MQWLERVLPWRPAFFKHIFKRNSNLLCHNCPTHLSHKCPHLFSHKCPIPTSPLCSTSHFMCFTWWTLMCQPVLVLPHTTHSLNVCRLCSGVARVARAQVRQHIQWCTMCGKLACGSTLFYGNLHGPPRKILEFRTSEIASAGQVSVAKMINIFSI